MLMCLICRCCVEGLGNYGNNCPICGGEGCVVNVEEEEEREDAKDTIE